MNSEPVFVDAGNTRVKIARYHDSGWELLGSGDYFQNDGWKVVIGRSLQEGRVIFTSVSDLFEQWVGEHHPNSDLLEALRAADIPPARLDYETPHTLGADRWLACAGAYALSRQVVAVCTAGSALTVDLMDQHGVFRGGVIMPGIDAIEAAAHHTAPRLPFGDVLNPVNIPARSTDDAVDAGARYLVSSAIDRILDEYEKDYGLVKVWVAGGRAESLKELISRECRSDAFLVFRGMRELALKPAVDS